jgi:hypothetical protein
VGTGADAVEGEFGGTFLDKKKQKKSTNKTKMDMFHATSRHEVRKYFAYAIEWELIHYCSHAGCQF